MKLYTKSFHLLQLVDYERELAEWRLQVTQQDARARSLAEAVRESDAKKRQLEDLADTLRDECAKLKAANQVSAAGEQQAAGEVRAALEQQVEQLRGAHTAQLAALRDELHQASQLHQDFKE